MNCGVQFFTGLIGILDFLKDNGFDTVPYKVYKPEEIPNNFDDFCKWCKSEMTYFWELSKIKDISTDGLVVDVNLKNIETNKDGIYLDRNKALKFEYWSYVYYKGKVKNLIIEQQAQDASVVIEIEPIKTKDNATATRVTGYNLFRVISLGLKPGSDIYFMRVSNTISVLLLGDKLDKMLESERKNAEKMESIYYRSRSGKPFDFTKLAGTK